MGSLRFACVLGAAGALACQTPRDAGLPATNSGGAAGPAPASVAPTPRAGIAPSEPGGAVDAGRPLAAASPTAGASAAAIDMVFWEKQVWKPGGGGNRLTLWADGHAETWVMPPGPGFVFDPPLKLRPGWRRVHDERLRFVYSDPFPRAEGKRRFEQAVAAGIDRLETFEPDYVDGAGTLVGFRRGGKIHEIVLPTFASAQHGTENHQRYVRVAEAFAGYDTTAF